MDFFFKRFIKTNSILKIVSNIVIIYPSPINLSYFWNFGSLAGIFLFIQILTGIFLGMHYVPNIELAFSSIEHVMRDVNYGWFLRYLHANGASMFFLIVYLHIARNLLYGSFLHPREFLWISGVLILLLMILTAFLGYVLPWGQMSFRAATVITNLASAIPFIGHSIVSWLWGGFAVDNATLNRFFSLHYLLPFLILGLVIIHILFLHENGSNNPLGIVSGYNNSISFHPYFIIKDMLGLWIFLIILFIYLFFLPNNLGHPDNYIHANPLVTPTHIVPEWYFLPFYAILRSVPDKLGGVCALLGSIIILFFLPFFFDKNALFERNFIYDFKYKIIIWFFFSIWCILGWIGGKSIEMPYYEIGQISSFLYFFLFIFLFNLGFILKNDLNKIYIEFFDFLYNDFFKWTYINAFWHSTSEFIRPKFYNLVFLKIRK